MTSGRLLLSALGISAFGILVLSACLVDLVQASDTGLILGGGAGASTTRDLGLTTTDELSWNVRCLFQTPSARQKKESP